MSASWWSRPALAHFAWLLVIAAPGASDVAAAQLTASWIDNSSGQAAFEIDRRAENDFAFSKIADVPAGSESYADSDVIEGVTYCYRVRAYTDSGASAYSDEACGFVLTAATAAQPGFTLWITKAGSGNGGIVSGASGAVVCGWTCTATYFPPDGIITLTAVAAQGSKFVGWSGGCSGTGPCTVAGNTTVAVTATFSQIGTP